MKSKDDKLGFPPGVAAKILLSVSSFFSKLVCIEFDRKIPSICHCQEAITSTLKSFRKLISKYEKCIRHACCQTQEV